MKKRKKSKKNKIRIQAPVKEQAAVKAEKEDAKVGESEQARGKKKPFGLMAAAFGAILIAAAVVIYFIFGGGKSSLNKAGLKDLNVVLITIDTLRADYLSCYKEGTARTPHLDKLAQEGARFERCISQTPLTLPSHVTILSGTYPLYHQVRDNGGFHVPGELDLVSEVLEAGGYNTSAFIGAYVLHSKWGMNQGFAAYNDNFNAGKSGELKPGVERRAAEVLDAAQEWIEANKDKKFFSWIHLYDPHSPYEAPHPYKKGYKGEVEYTDACLGNFFQFLKDTGLYDKTLIIVTADHGEDLNQHGEQTHGLFIYETSVRVPLIIRAPFAFPKKHIDGSNIVELVDIAPTILDALDIPAPATFQGVSFLDLLYGKTGNKKSIAYTESYYSRLHFGWSELKGIYSSQWKFILAPHEELFDIHGDTNETNNLALKKSPDARRLRQRLQEFTRKYSQNALAYGGEKNLNSEDARKLASLGYLTGTMKTDGKTQLPDPKDKLGIFNDYLKAQELLTQRKDGEKIDEAITLLENIAQKEPDNVECLMLLGAAYGSKNNHAESAKYFSLVLKKKPDYNGAVTNLLTALTYQGQLDTAIEEAEKYIKIFPNDNALYNELGGFYFLKKDYDRALQLFQKSIELKPENAAAYNRIGEIHMLKEKYDSAEPFLKKALSLDPKIIKAHFFLAVIELVRGKGDQAVIHFRKEIEVNPQFKKPYFMVADHLLKSGGNLDEAIQLCKKGVAIPPEDDSTLFGYFVLTNIYTKLGDKANFDYYDNKGAILAKKLDSR